MKKKTLLLTICSALVLIGTSAFYTPLHRFVERRALHAEREVFESEEEREREREREEGEGELEADGPQELLEIERELTIDPELGRVPTERLYAAMEYYTRKNGRNNTKAT